MRLFYLWTVERFKQVDCDREKGIVLGSRKKISRIVFVIVSFIMSGVFFYRLYYELTVGAPTVMYGIIIDYYPKINYEMFFSSWKAYIGIVFLLLFYSVSSMFLGFWVLIRKEPYGDISGDKMENKRQN